MVFPNFVLRLPVKNISGGNTIKGPFEWAGPGDQYFTALFIPDDPDHGGDGHPAQRAAGATRSAKAGLPKKPANVDVLGAAVGDLRGPDQ